MQHENLWQSLAKSQFAPQLMKFIFQHYQTEMNEIGYTQCERDKDNARVMFDRCPDEIKTQLETLDKIRQEQLTAAMMAGLQRGLYHGFEQFFTEEPTEQPFQELFQHTIKPLYHEKQCHIVAEKRKQGNELSASLESQLDFFTLQSLTSIELAYEEQEYGLLRYAFLLGYHVAHETICEIDSPEVFVRTAERIWQTEKELGFVSDISGRWK